MNKVSRVKDENFTVISNVFLRDKNLTIKSKGFLAVVMGLPSNWEFSINGICSILQEGKTAIYSIIDELKENGYCKVVTCRDEKGRITGSDYTFFEEPQIEKQETESPYSENPNMDNQPQLNTNSIKDLLDKKLNEEKEKSLKKKSKVCNDFIDRMYALYPSKCPMRGTTLGKSRKDKDRLKKLLTLYSEEMIERVIRHEINEKFGKHYMQNFSTFLNNFPDPATLAEAVYNDVSKLAKVEQPYSIHQLNLGEVIYR